MAKLKLLSLFTGAGGLDIGFELTGLFETLVALEIQPEYAETLLRNQTRGFLRKATVVSKDIRDLDPRQVADRYFENGHIDGIIGGPPCEAFSVLGKRKGLSDPRGLLIFDFIRWAVKLKPRFILMENVPPLAKLEKGRILDQLHQRLREAGFATCSGVLNAADYGAATRRRRLILLASLGSSVELPNPTHTEGTPAPEVKIMPAITVRNAFEGLPEPGPDPTAFPTWHRRVNHTIEVERRFASLRPGQRDNIRKRARLELDRPSPAIVAGNLEGTRTPIHPTEPRELTNRETARLHGFPDNYEFCGTRSAVCKQIANSVPIPFATAIATSIFYQLFERME